MAIVLSDNIQTNAQSPTDSRYYNGLTPWTSVSAVNAGIVSGVRYTGLTVNIAGVEYWYCGGIGDSNLCIKTAGSTSAASGERVTKLVNQASHGFDVGDVLGWSGGTYNLAIADGNYDGEIVGIVSKCYNTSCFDLTQSGYITGLTSLVANTTYFLSPTTAGLLTSTRPTTVGQIVKAALIADTTTTGWVLPYPGYMLSVSSGSSAAAISQYTITGNSSSTGFLVNHGKSNQFVIVDIVENFAPYSTVYTEVQRPNANCVCVLFDDAPDTGVQYKILIIS
jgi:hypothetical protein